MAKFAKIPFLTIALIVLSVLYYETVRTPPSNRFVQWLLSSIIHDPNDPNHILGNILGLAIIGPIVELWIPRSLKERFTLFTIALGINQLGSLRIWWFVGQPSIGLSLYIFVFIAFALYYYWLRQTTKSRIDRLVPIAIGWVIGFWFANFYGELVQSGLMFAVGQNWHHGLAFGTGLVAIYLYLLRKEKEHQHGNKHGNK